MDQIEESVQSLVQQETIAKLEAIIKELKTKLKEVLADRGEP